VTGTDKSFASKGLDTRRQVRHTLCDEGDFSLHLHLHPFMTGIVHVRKQ